MWCVCLFLAPPRPFHLVIPKHATPSHIPSVSLPRRRRPLDVCTAQQAGDLGHTLLATVKSNPIPIPIPKQQQQRKQEEGEEETQLSGSDVLWALQRATSRNKKKKKQEQRRVSSSVVAPREQSAVDYTNVRPLRINTHWAEKLDELEKRLRELSDTI